jgi:long-subunit fatty acid transport protein
MLQAQVPDDALRNSWFTQNGTARNMATGGVMGSLGGDITPNNVNPAGLGLFKTNEFVFTPGVGLNNNKFSFREDESKSKKTGFNLGATGFIWGIGRQDSRWRSSAFSISVNQLANFNNRVSYRGRNNESSFTEQYLEELIRDRADTNAVESNYIFGSTLAYRTYLIDQEKDASGKFIGFQSLVPVSTGILQENDITTSGGYHEASFAFANNMEDKLYLGASINFPVISYSRDTRYKETDATTNKNNDFNYFEFTETANSRGIGANVKMGFIYKPQEFIRLGLALHSPSFISFKDNIRAAITADTEGYAGVRTVTSDALNSGNAGERNYSMTTPLRMIGSASYVFREVNDTRRQRGFISADLEYVNYRSSRFYSADEEDVSSKDYYKSLNTIVKDYYKDAVNVRVGGELKFHTLMVRGGAAYYGNPYKDSKNLKANRTQASGGLGYRNRGMFLDLTYVHTFNKDVNFPYRLNDKANTYALQTGSRGNVVATVGFKF